MVSVIIPNYNHAEFLEQRIESVLNQSWQELEVIILDDCSTDNSRQIIERYRGHDKILDIICNDRNSGSTFQQWKKGIEASSGEFVWIAESDDWCEPSFLQTIMSGLEKSPDAVVGYCQSYCIQDRNLIKWKSAYPLLVDCVEGREFVSKFMLNSTAIFNASMAVWRRSAYKNISQQFTSYRYCGDWLFWIELCRQGKVFVSGKVLNYFRAHENDVSTKMVSSGNGLAEEIAMFRLLLTREWITHDQFLGILKQKYIDYRLIRQSLSKEKRTELEATLTQDTGISRAALQKGYFNFYLKHGFINFVSRISR